VKGNPKLQEFLLSWPPYPNEERFDKDGVWKAPNAAALDLNRGHATLSLKPAVP
jgi:hypothetical protein